MIKNIKKNYWKPTPKKWRQIGDAILAVGTSLVAYAAFMEYKELAITAAICTAVGKFITNFFKED